MRKRTWAVGAVGVLCVILAIGIASWDTGHEPPALAVSSVEDVSERGAQEPGEVATGEDAESLTLEIESEPSEGDLPQDPVAALTVLLSTRNACVRDLSVECLEAVSSTDSPAFAADASHIESVVGGGELAPGLLLDAAVAVEVQRLGDSVLFEFDLGDESKPASLLLVKGEAGWRIRSYTLPE
ncbi:hypothetical protein [Salinibacterium sp. NK8237]|uniref:hypothetical protein n=1 Tax=Salinibacterium sp. NK8237 TaxID=2792038 RepID=UPI0018CFB5BA|nr:hypothetical protein [Salinibacterium sp. NK8237]MBH0129136.1 hypothetical protein [Salinibacterium sp. NK8237]